jgi:polysaccharide deacetylase family protein (PEP-CTERM system associated)
MKNVMTVDVEDYFHVEAFARVIPTHEWHRFPPRVEQNVSRILELFAKYQVRGTFFILGWVAEKFPWLARKIAAAGHEIGCHGYAHKRLHSMTPDQFQQDVRKATAFLTDQVGRSIGCFRAPSFSIVSETLWALDVLSAEGYSFDSSIFPVRHDMYGIPDAERFAHWRSFNEGGSGIFEFPLSTIACRGLNIGVGGGGYLRWIPYGITHWAVRHINQVHREPAIVYFHPWEIDPDQPALRAGMKSTLRHYTNLSTMEEKVERLLQDFQFGTLSEVCLQHKNYRAEFVDAANAVAQQVQPPIGMRKSAHA